MSERSRALTFAYKTIYFLEYGGTVLDSFITSGSSFRFIRKTQRLGDINSECVTRPYFVVEVAIQDLLIMNHNFCKGWPLQRNAKMPFSLLQLQKGLSVEKYSKLNREKQAFMNPTTDIYFIFANRISFLFPIFFLNWLFDSLV